MSSIFAARKEFLDHQTEVSDKSPSSQGGVSDVSDFQLIELTRIDQYSVSKLPSQPAFLRNYARWDESEHVYEGTVDSQLGYGLVVSNKSVYVWNYNSKETVPVTIAFDVEQKDDIPWKAVLVDSLPRKFNERASDPGLLLFNSSTGLVKYFEEISSSPSVGILNNKIIEHQLPLSGEFITKTDYYKQVGVIVSTSKRRVFLLRLKDSAGKPFISHMEIQHQQTSFLSGLLHRQTYHSYSKLETPKIVSTKLLKGNLSTNSIVILDSEGSLSIVDCNRDSVSQLVGLNLKDRLTSSLAEVYPHVGYSFKVHDIAQLEQPSDFLILCSFHKEPITDERYLMLLTIQIQKDDILINASYKINSHYSNSKETPTLYISSAKNTAFVVSGNSIILMDLFSSIDKITRLERKWEDAVNLKNEISILGTSSKNSGPSDGNTLYVLTKQSGILQICRFLSHLSDETENDNILDGMELIKSHIEQAIYYGGMQTNPLNFDSNKFRDGKEVEKAIIEVADEILLNTSEYLPQFAPVLVDYLKKKGEIMNRLCQLIAAIKDISDQVKLKVLFDYEKLTTLTSFYQEVSQDSKLTKLLISVINDKYGIQPDDALNKFVLYHANDVIDVMKAVFKQCPNQTILKVFDPVALSFLNLESELKYSLFKVSRYSSEITLSHPIFLKETGLLLLIDKALQDLPTSKEYHDLLFDVSRFLYYTFNDLILWNRNENQKSISEAIQSIFDRKRIVNLLIYLRQHSDILEMAEQFQDFITVLDVLDDQRETINSQIKCDLTPEIERKQAALLLKFHHFFETYGFHFASTLYQYYIDNHKPKVALLGFPEFDHYLEQFFEQNSDRLGKLAWIRDLIYKDYFSAAQRLVNEASEDQDEPMAHKKLQLSLAKLSILSIGNSTSLLENLLENIDINLSLINLQEILAEELSKLIISKKDISKFTQSVQPLMKQSLEKSLERMLDRKSLTISSLLEVLTLIDPVTNSLEMNCYHAFKVLALLYTSNSTVPYFLKECENLVWKRLLLKEDWSKLSNTENKSESYISELLEKSSFSRIIKRLVNHGYINTKNPTDSVIRRPSAELLDSLTKEYTLNEIKVLRSGNGSANEYDYEDDSEENEKLNALRKEYNNESAELKALIEEYEIADWIETVMFSQ
ncbi:Nuclear pore complex subunit [Komagataella phaffii CBS 7435]|uniref:Subunit of the Nup84p subcomplex of the nuclear pore complex (NPC) n=2 Tax=Komagataella phaffii TaxID=460519 RepID=C4R669_KOMPG|nr:Subunit of the Nup84p subcomplex of the nuclear pore complex (NPC) [Komagataella phaffii GS115]AOA63662.1 GQ67_04123T0 [Komagataella phaffii]CAH2449107.1 Nuclear pore complex subunit [Komagataella phaffii CBS 7435]AOA68398.1 GQ68_04096T0 [Komagataella phaffii GS115]CAY71055.1 Subunit of the Nup84p subcomplex of the nuclear pore complex (NPC) [Komagataella phaffii GS115]CCA39149.1 Nuclear pore complex subunit [Komagataella phaffii CBS 7435]